MINKGRVFKKRFEKVMEFWLRMETMWTFGFTRKCEIVLVAMFVSQDENLHFPYQFGENSPFNYLIMLIYY